MNVAVTFVFEFKVILHVLAPLQPPPLQPMKTESADGVAVNVNEEPAIAVSLQSIPQLIPAGELETAPVPDPFFAIANV